MHSKVSGLEKRRSFSRYSNVNTRRGENANVLCGLVVLQTLAEDESEPGVAEGLREKEYWRDKELELCKTAKGEGSLADKREDGRRDGWSV